ncbi:hypothetical protein [Bradyrhizobium sp. JYMT SZCCT0180]|uniref:hypothetical protein n=1 Tax=Bradyrhizobium sp. JYMT SZCCT0180 TaxID=2807666 RepID=UPI001BA89833|nr:hypothetical protein [Bradyrhizobium sp. JYMT SZCCT0180]MBR1214645.1 hypothetical protein [Bradyrhizobium sp. JYMT SZCCT0180]
MTVKLSIDRLVIDAAAGQRINPATLRAAVERQLSAMIEGGGTRTFPGAPARMLTSSGYAASGSASKEARLARDVAKRIYEAMKR